MIHLNINEALISGAKLVMRGKRSLRLFINYDNNDKKQEDVRFLPEGIWQ